MQALTFPFHIDPQGRLAVVTTYPEVVRGQLIDVLMTNRNERAMRPTYGADLRSALFDPTDELMRHDGAGQVVERINSWTPRVILQGVQFTNEDARPAHIFLNVSYRVGMFEEASILRLPVSAFLNEESEV